LTIITFTKAKIQRAIKTQVSPILIPLLTRKTVVFATVAINIHQRDKSTVYLNIFSLFLEREKR
jgi:hypothetical protein